MSPILANFYLEPLDRDFYENGFELVRYVDDLIVMCRDREEAARAHELAREMLTKLELRMHPLDQETNGKIKTRIRAPGLPFTFLGLEFTTHAIRPAESKFKRIEKRIEEITDAKAKLVLKDVIMRINVCLKRWIQAYTFCSLTKGDVARLDNHIERCVRRWLLMRGFGWKEKHISDRAFGWLGLNRAAGIPLDPILRPRKNVNPLSANRIDGNVSLLSLSKKNAQSLAASKSA